MNIRMLRSIRGALFFTKAGGALERGDYGHARLFINEARTLLGEKIYKPNLFEFHIRAAIIYYKLNEYHLTEEYAKNAIQSITNNRYMRDNDRKYLLDYCDRLLDDIDVDPETYEYRIHVTDYTKVSKRYLRQYPLLWHHVSD
jgi:hypothetical protein